MQSDLASEYGLWLELVLALTVGTAVIVGLAALAGRLVVPAAWRRTIWQVAILGLLVLIAVETSGTGRALVRLCRTQNVFREGVPLNARQPVPVTAAGTTQHLKTEPYRTVQADTAVDRADGQVHSATAPSPGQTVPWADPPDMASSDTALPEMVSPDIAATEDAIDAVVPLRYETDWHETDWEATSWDPADREDADRENADREDAGWEETGRNPAAAGYLALSDNVEPQDDDRRQEPSRRPAVAATVPPGSSCAWWPGLIWALGTTLIVGRIGFAQGLLCLFRRRQAAAGDESLCRRVRALARRLGIQRRVGLLRATGLAAPVAFGTFRPTVALPVGFAEDFDPRQQEAILAHELAHLAAGDPAWQLAADLLCAVLWWHPLVWWSRRCLRAASEASADEASLLVPDGPDVLADCLVAMGRRLAGWRELGWLSVRGSGFRSALGRRVERLLCLSSRPWQAPRRRRLALARTVLPAALVIVTVTCTAWLRPQATSRQGETTMTVLTTSWRNSLAAMAMVALMSPAADATADDLSPGEPDNAVASEAPADAIGQVALLGDEEEQEARERAEREEAEARERAEREEAEAREHAEREEAEAREHAEREDGEAREREERERGEGREEAQRHVQELKEAHRELREAAQRIRRELDGVERPEQARELLGEFKDVRAKIAAIERELHGAEREGQRRHAEDRDVRERDAPGQELRQHHRALEEKSQDISRRLEELPDGAEGDRHELRRALEQIQERIQGVEREMGGSDRPGPRPDQRERAEAKRHVEELIQQRRELDERAHGIKRELEELGDRAPDKSEQLHAALREIQERSGDLERKAAEIMRSRKDRPGPPPEERERTMRHPEELKEQMRHLSEQGRHEDAQRVEHKAHELWQRLKQRPDGPPPGPPEGDALDRRIRHLKAAAENLHAAGMQDQADHLRQQVERLIEEHRRRGDHRPDGPPHPPEHPDGLPRPPEHPDGPPQPEHAAEAVHQLRGEMGELRREMDELRGMLKELLQREPRDPR